MEKEEAGMVSLVVIGGQLRVGGTESMGDPIESESITAPASFG